MKLPIEELFLHDYVNICGHHDIKYNVTRAPHKGSLTLSKVAGDWFTFEREGFTTEYIHASMVRQCKPAPGTTVAQWEASFAPATANKPKL